LGKPALGIAVSHHSCPIKALERRAQSPAQDRGRVGGASKGSGRVAAGMPAEGRQAVLQTKRWLPDRRLIVAADASFAAIDLVAALRCHACLVTRLRIDASLFAPAPPRRAGQMGRPRVKGRRLPAFKAVLADPKTVWVPITVTEWGSSRAGAWKRRSRKRAPTSASKHSGSGPTSPSCARPPRCSDCSP